MRKVIVIMALCILSVSIRAQAQSSEAQVRQLVKNAMEDYGSLIIDAAKDKLDIALDLAREKGITGTVLASIHINRGIVQAGGFMNNTDALESFKKAVCIDPEVKLDKLYSTPDIQTTFLLAKNQVQDPGACDELGVSSAVEEIVEMVEEVEEKKTPSRTGPSVPDCARFVPVEEQLVLHPVPFYIEIDSDMELTTSRILLFYRRGGEKKFRQAELEKHDKGFGAKIGCDYMVSANPSVVEYNIWIMDLEDKPMCKIGTPEEPFKVSMVDKLKAEPPVLPGEKADISCVADRPPEPVIAELGERCTEKIRCATGLECVDEVCEEEGEKDETPLMHIDLGFGTGFGVIRQSRTLDADPYHVTDEQRSWKVEGGFALSPVHARLGVGFFVMEKLSIDANLRANLYFNDRTEYVCETKSKDSEDCAQWSQVPNDDGQLDYETKTSTDPMAWLVTLRARYIFMQETDMDLYAWAGFGYGSIRHMISYNDKYKLDDEGNPEMTTGYPESGMFDVTVGPGFAWYFIKELGIMIELPVDFLFPDFAFNLDLNVGLTARF